ncbi:class I SAM-dependent methyltransferase [Roseomonas sp. WA12]
MPQTLDLPPEAFRKADSSPDDLFYQQPRFVTHIDDGAIAAVTSLYRSVLPAGGSILDLMSSWVSHLPEEVAYGEVTGHGMNAAELAANPRLSHRFTQDLNRNPILPLEDAAFDAACLCVSVQYLQQPVAVFSDVARVLRPGAPFVVSFSNRCFPTKAVAIWQALGGGEEQQRLVAAYMAAAGFAAIERQTHRPAAGDPLWAVIGRR